MSSGEPVAGISSESDGKLTWFPPLAFPDPDWAGEPSPLDEFYELLADSAATVRGEVEIDGHTTLLVELIGHEKDQNGHTIAARGFIDPESAAIPRRIEFCRNVAEFPEHLGPWETHPKIWAQRVVKDVQIEEVADGFFYPMSGVIEYLGISPGPESAVSKLHPEQAVHEVQTWEVDNVEINRPMDVAMFRMSFPAGTVFLDGRTNERLVAGDVEGFATRRVEAARNYEASWWAQWNGAFIAAALVLVIGLLAMFLWWRR